MLSEDISQKSIDLFTSKKEYDPETGKMCGVGMIAHLLGFDFENSLYHGPHYPVYSYISERFYDVSGWGAEFDGLWRESPDSAKEWLINKVKDIENAQ